MCFEFTILPIDKVHRVLVAQNSNHCFGSLWLFSSLIVILHLVILASISELDYMLVYLPFMVTFDISIFWRLKLGVYQMKCDVRLNCDFIRR